ncbi:MAG: phage tail tape measure protein [Intestinibacter bartlettii]|uniref:phage tail tape measure protein n=1 Tax=Intestinibacter bartlettii TaxID=261299 RepID=UPI0039A03F69
MSLNLGSAIGYLELDSSRWTNSYTTARQQMQTLADSSQSMGSRFQAAGSMLTSAGSTLTTHVTLPLVGIGTASVKTAADFESSMSNVQALSGATGSELQQLSDLAKEMGATTQFSASECADALGYMALAGWDTQQSMDALPGVLNLAAASGMDLANASDAVTDILSAFGMQASDAGMAADQFAYAQANANTSADQLTEAMSNCGVNANGFGQDLTQTNAVLMALSNEMLKGAPAGTALSAVFRDMGNAMKDGCIQIGKTKVQITDSKGNFLDMTEIIKGVEKATNGMSESERQAALSSTFTADSIKAMGILLNEGSDKVAGYADQLENCGGSAEKMAEVMNDNLNGQITALKSALEGAAISIGEALLPMIKGLVSVLQGALTWFNGLNSGVKTTIVTVGLVVAAIGPLLLILGSLASAIGNLIELRALMTGSSVLSSAIGRVSGLFTSLRNVIMGSVVPAIQSLWAFMLANPITIVIAAIAALVAGFVYLWNNCESFRNFWINLWDNIVEVVTKIPETIQNLGQQFQAAFQNIIISLRMLLLNGINTMKEAFSNGLATLLDPIINWGYSVNGYLGDAFTDLYGIIEDTFNLIADYIRDFASIMISIFTGDWQGALQGVQNLFSNLGNNIMNILSDLKNFISEIFMGIVEAIKGNLSQAYNNVVNWASQMTSKAREAGSNFLKNVISAIQNLPSKVWSLLSQAISKAANFVSQFGQKATQAGRTFTTNIVNGVKSIPSKMVSIGKSIVQGIWKGISGAGSWLRSQISNFASNIVKGFKSSFKINSPSKIMRDIIGKGIVEGIGVGIDNEEDSLLTKADKLAGNVVDTMNGNIATTNLFDTAKSLTDSMAIANQTNSSQENNTNRFASLLHIENLTINDDKDIETLANDLAFYLKRKNVLTV